MTFPRNRTLHRSIFGALLLVLAMPLAQAQMAHQGPAKAIERAKTLQPFDVISVKQNDSGEDNGGINFDDRGSVRATNMPFAALLQYAYDIKSDQIIGLSGPVNSARFDITAKALPPGDGPPKEMDDADLQAKLVLLLEDRFHLKVHLQPKVMSVYDLVVVHGGPKIKLSQDEIKANNWNTTGEGTNRVLIGTGMFMTDLAMALSDHVGRKVVDKTGLTGHADIKLTWSDDVALTQGGPDAISIYTAIEEQLGLKLQPAKGPVDTLLIDHIEMPSQN